MGQSTERLASGIRRFRVLIVALVFVIMGTAIAAYAWNTNSGMTLPSTGTVTITGYGASSAAHPSTQPQTVVLTKSQTTILRNQISAIPTLSLPSRSLSCVENETVFEIVVKSAQGSPKTVWTAQAVLCPAPGILYIYGKDAGTPTISRYCTLKPLVLSFFPKGKVNGTRQGLRFC